MIKVQSRTAKISRGWKVLLLLLACGVVCLSVLAAAPSLLQEKGYNDAQWVATQVYRRSTDDLLASGIITPRVKAKLEERRKKFGDVTSFHVQETVVEIMSYPWGLHVKVTRRGGEAVEDLGGNGRCVSSYGVLPPEAYSR